MCTNARGSGKPTCAAGGCAIAEGVTANLVARRAIDVLVTETACLGPCFDGPNAVIYPDGIWLGELDASDVSALVDILTSDGPIELPTALAAKQLARPGGDE